MTARDRTARHIADLNGAVLAMARSDAGRWTVATRASTVYELDTTGQVITSQTLVPPPYELTAYCRSVTGLHAIAVDSTDQLDLHKVIVLGPDLAPLDPTLVAPVLHTAHRVTGIAWNDSGDRLAIADRHDRWVLDHRSLLRWRDLGTNGSFEVAAWVDRRTVIWGGAGGFEMVDLHYGVLRAVDGAGVITCVATDPSRTRLLSGDAKGEIRITSLATGEALGLDGFSGRIDHVWWERDAIAAVIDDSVLRWRLEGIEVVGDPEWDDLDLEPGDWVTAAVPTGDDHVMVGCRSGRLLQI